MNYFGHAAIASFRGGSAPFVLGAMLPDLCAMVGLPLPEGALDELCAGVQYHIDTDAVFHQTEMFVRHNHRVLAQLRGRGVGRGPARAAAHIGVEMLIDATLIERQESLQTYLHALHWGSHELSAKTTPSWNFLDRTKMSGLCKLLHQRAEAVHAPSAQRFYERLGNTLSGRRLLEPNETELGIIAETLHADDEVARDIPQLLAEMRCPKLGLK